MAATPPKPSSRIVIPEKLTRKRKALAFFAQAVIRMLSSTWTYRIRDPHGYLQRNQRGPVIYCLWHNRLAVAPGLFQFYEKRFRPSAKIAVLVSASNDGALLARVLKYFGMAAVRGSSSRRGGQALLELNRWMEKGYNVGITPDGPRGPRYRIGPGIISLAQTSQAPILPISSRVAWKKCLKSWDQFQIPLPFARIHIHVGPLIRVPKNIEENERLKFQSQLSEIMDSLTID